MNETQKQEFDDLRERLTSCVHRMEVCGKIAAMKLLMSWIQTLQQDILCDLMETDNDLVQINEMSEGSLGVVFLPSNRASKAQRPDQTAATNSSTSSSQVSSVQQASENGLDTCFPPHAFYGSRSKKPTEQASACSDAQVESTTQDVERPTTSVSPDVSSTVPNKKPKIGPKSFKERRLQQIHRESAGDEQDNEQVSRKTLSEQDLTSGNSLKRKVNGEVNTDGNCDIEHHDESHTTQSVKRRRTVTDESETAQCHDAIQNVTDANRSEPVNRVSMTENAEISDDDDDNAAPENFTEDIVAECSQSEASTTDRVEKISEKSQDSTKDGKQKKSQYLSGFRHLQQDKRSASQFYKCNTCDKVLRYQHTESHKKQHLVHDRKYLSCDSCEYKTGWPESMKRHMRTQKCGSYTDLTIEPVKSVPREDTSNVPIENGKALSDDGVSLQSYTSVMEDVSAECRQSDTKTNEEKAPQESEDTTKADKKRKMPHVEGFCLLRIGYSNTGVFKCTECGKVLKGNFGASEHRKQHLVPDGKYLKCDSCEHTCRWRHMMRKHVLSHKSKNFTDLTVKCGLMPAPRKQISRPPLKLKLKQAKKVLRKRLVASKGKSLSQKSNIAKVRTRFQCKTCGKTLTTSTTLKIHEKQHMVPYGRFILCKLCPALYSNVSSMASHVDRMHVGASYKDYHDLTELKKQASQTPGKPHAYRCPLDECMEEFMQLSRVQDHIFHHVWGVENFVKCRHCEKQFKFRHLAQKHTVKEHRGEDEHGFDFVNHPAKKLQAESNGTKKKVRVTERASAVNSTSEITWYPCPIPCCSAIFKNRHYLKEHAKQHKAKDGKYLSCKYCSSKLRWRDCMVRHLKKCHGIARYEADRDWKEIRRSDSSVLTGSQNWAGSSVGTGRCTKSDVSPLPKQTKKNKVVAKKLLLKGYPKKQKAKATRPAKSSVKERLSCVWCLQTFRQKALLLKHIRVQHKTKSPKRNVDWIVQEANVVSSNAVSSNEEISTAVSSSECTSQSHENSRMEENGQEQMMVSDTSTFVASAADVYLDNAEDPSTDTAENLAEQSDMKTEVYNTPQLQPQVTDMPECSELHTQGLPTLEPTILDGTNSRTHNFFMKGDAQCDVCAEKFRWGSQLNAHIERCHRA